MASIPGHPYLTITRQDGTTYRLFQGWETRQIDGHTGKPAMPTAWYFEPADYEGDVLYSADYADRAAAEEAANED